MLPEPLRLLISAYAAGDLSPRRQSAAMRLLRHSAAARRLLKELKLNRRRLRAVPRPKLPAEFTDRVINALPQKTPIIQPSSLVLSQRSRVSSTSRWAAAAVVFIAIAVGTLIWVSLPGEPKAPGGGVARRPKPQAQPELVQLPSPEPGEEVGPAGPPTTTDLAPAAADRAIARNEKPADDPMPTPAAEPLGTTVPPTPKLTKVPRPRLSVLAVADLDNVETRQIVRHELNRADDHQIDLFCRDSTKGFERLQNALKARGVRVIVDGLVQEGLKRKARAQYLVYCDDLTALEWVQVFQALAAADKRSGDAVFDQAVFLPLEPADHNELASVLGTDPSQPDAKPRVGAGGPKTDARKTGKLAVAASLVPWRTTPASKEVRQYLDGRPERPAESLAVLLVLRTPGN
jgi:hypothetical protein